MSLKIRLQRKGKKNKSFYHIVVSDSRFSRDGKFIEKIGTYNPNINPSDINLEIEKSIEWLNKGAVVTNRVKCIFRLKGVFLKKHLLRGVKMGKIKKKEVDEKFIKWKKL